GGVEIRADHRVARGAERALRGRRRASLRGSRRVPGRHAPLAPASPRAGAAERRLRSGRRPGPSSPAHPPRRRLGPDPPSPRRVARQLPDVVRRPLPRRPGPPPPAPPPPAPADVVGLADVRAARARAWKPPHGEL
ncbi:MAG: hypothetical protein AVDCRST_MAG68-1529, partial [uncultured Gemmatimonadetes bacterium]